MANFCRNCGGKVEADDKFCAQCGTRLDKEPEKAEVQEMETQKQETQEDGKWNKYDWEKDEWVENPQQEGQKKPVNMKKFILNGILLAIPFVNLVVCVALLMNKNTEPGHRKFIKIWFILNIIGLILGCLLAYFVVQFLLFDHPVDIHQQMEYTIPQMQFMKEFITEL